MPKLTSSQRKKILEYINTLLNWAEDFTNAKSMGESYKTEITIDDCTFEITIEPKSIGKTTAKKFGFKVDA